MSYRNLNSQILLFHYIHGRFHMLHGYQQVLIGIDSMTWRTTSDCLLFITARKLCGLVWEICSVEKHGSFCLGEHLMAIRGN